MGIYCLYKDYGENQMKDLAIKYDIPNTLVIKNGESQLVASMVLTTLSICFLMTFVPQLTPLWMRTA